jgi:hypothetical protein
VELNKKVFITKLSKLIGSTVLHEFKQRGIGMSNVADPGCLFRIPDPNFSIPDPGSKEIPDPGSGSLSKN